MRRAAQPIRDRASRGGLLVAVFLVLGCSDKPRSVSCRFGTEHDVAETSGAQFDGIEAVSQGGAPIVIWSESAGLWVRRLDERGAPAGDPIRLSDRCRGGLAGASGDPGLAVACLRRPDPSTGKPGGVTLLMVDDAGRVERRLRFGTAGRDSRGVDVVFDGDTPVVAWHDGTPGQHRVFTVRIDSPTPRPVSVSRPETNPGAPDMLLHDGRVIAAWAETVFDQSGETVGEVMIRAGDATPLKVASLLYDDARPVLARDSGGLVVGFRDINPVGSRAGLFVQRLADDLTPRGDPRRVGRANGVGRPWLVPCDRGMFTVSPRSYSRWEVIVGINRLGPGLARECGERQMYGPGMDYSEASAVCVDERALIIVGERGTSTQRLARMRSMTLQCD